MKPLIVEDVSKNFGGLQALSNICLSIEPGEKRALIGPNGSGKTTLFNLISGILEPSRGRIFIFGKDVTKSPCHYRSALGMARTFQITALFPRLTVQESVMLSAAALSCGKSSLLRPLTSYKHILTQAQDLVEQFGLGDKQDIPIRELSYGDQRQVEFMLALAKNPKLLLADEPTSGLSAVETANMVSLIQGFSKDITVFLIEHDIDVASKLTDRVTVLDKGRIIADGDWEEIRRNAQVQEIYIGGQQ